MSVSRTLKKEQRVFTSFQWHVESVIYVKKDKNRYHIFSTGMNVMAGFVVIALILIYLFMHARAGGFVLPPPPSPMPICKRQILVTQTCS